MQIEVNQRQIQAVHALLDDLKVNSTPVLVRSINRTTVGTRSRSVDLITRKLNTAKKNVRKDIAISKAHRNRLSGRVDIKGRLLPLTFFSARQGKRGTSFKIWKDRGRERLKHAFVESMKTGHKGVFERNTGHREYDGRLPIEEKMGPSIPTVFIKTPGLEKTTMVGASQRLALELDSQLDLILKKHKNAAV